MDQQQSRWRPTRRHLLWTVGIIVALVGAYIFLRFAYVREWKWTGLVKNANYHKRTLWDWLDLLIVPVVLAIGGYLFTRSENLRTQQIANDQRDLDRAIADERTKEDRKIAQERAETDRQIADQRRQDDALQAYLDHIGELLLDKDKPLRQSEEGDEVRMLARARTLTVLRRLDGERRGRVLQFLYESELIAKDHVVVDLGGVALARADLTNANLVGANLSRADLFKASLDGANLTNANLVGADLPKASLRWAKLNGTNLSGANLVDAYLVDARLIDACLAKANLMDANLSGAALTDAVLNDADLSRANLSGADLSGADLTDADLNDASVTSEQLAKCVSLKDATMPDGQILKGDINPDGLTFEEWLKSKRGGEDGENSGPS